MTRETLIIDNIDPDLLDYQRLLIWGWVFQNDLPSEVGEALEGILMMLDNWSDRRYYESRTEKGE